MALTICKCLVCVSAKHHDKTLWYKQKQQWQYPSCRAMMGPSDLFVESKNTFISYIFISYIFVLIDLNSAENYIKDKIITTSCQKLDNLFCPVFDSDKAFLSNLRF